MTPSAFRVSILALAWVLAVGLALGVRPALPITETRYLTVAWEMHLSGDWLVPHLNSLAYSHKPPLLFWIINVGWQIFGVSEFWARLVAPLFGVGSLALTAVLARQLWPGRENALIAATAPLILFGAGQWLYMATLTYFDLLVTFFALLGAIGLVRSARGYMVSGFILLGVGIGLGILAKGPVILLQVLPLALLAPLWAANPAWRGGAAIHWRRWYGGVLAALALGAAMALSWAVPAALAGGDTFANELFWTQSAGRMVDSFAVRQPFWFYAALLPALYFPWALWPPAWRAMAPLRRGGEPATRFCLLWFLAGLVILSLVSGKQQHYILPLAPAMALLLARQLSNPNLSIRGRDQAIPAAIVFAIGAILAAGVYLARSAPDLLPALRKLKWLADYPLSAGIALAASAALIFWLGRANGKARAVPLLSGLSMALFTVLHLSVFTAPEIMQEQVADKVAKYLREQELAGRPIAILGVYNGEYHFLGRIERPFAEIDLQGPFDWLSQNPEGLVVTRTPKWPEGVPEPLYKQPFRGRILGIWEAKVLLAAPQAFGLGQP